MPESRQKVPRISVLMGPYTSASTSTGAIVEIQEQPHTHCDVETLDDRSVDAPLAVVRRFVVCEDRIKAFANRGDFGPSPTLNNRLAQIRAALALRMEANYHNDLPRLHKQVGFLTIHRGVTLLAPASPFSCTRDTWARNYARTRTHRQGLIHEANTRYPSVMICLECDELGEGSATREKCCRLRDSRLWLGLSLAGPLRLYSNEYELHISGYCVRASLGNTSLGRNEPCGTAMKVCRHCLRPYVRSRERRHGYFRIQVVMLILRSIRNWFTTSLRWMYLSISSQLRQKGCRRRWAFGTS